MKDKKGGECRTVRTAFRVRPSVLARFKEIGVDMSDGDAFEKLVLRYRWGKLRRGLNQ